MSTSDQPGLNFAVIGCGHIGKRHCHLIQQHPSAQLLAAVDPRPREELFDGENTFHFFPSLDEMLAADLPIDVVNIASPNGLHAPQAIQCLQAGKHVVIEKPIALSRAEAEEVIYTALNCGKQVFGVMQNRYSPPAHWLKELVSSGLLGKINQVQINCYWNRDERYYTGKTWHGSTELDGGVLFTQFSHFIDIMYWLFGDITNIYARHRNFNHQDLTSFDDSGTVLFDFLKGGSGTINFSTSCWDQNFESSLSILAEKGTLKVGGQYMDKVEYCHVKDYQMPELQRVSPPNDYGGYKGSAANHHQLIQNVIDVLSGNGTITTNALEGLKVVDIIERIYQAAAK